MKKTDDWNDTDFVDLDDEYVDSGETYADDDEEDYEDGYDWEEDYEDDFDRAVGLPDKRILIPAVAAAALLIITVIFVIVTTGRKTQELMSVNNAAAEQEEPGNREHAGIKDDTANENGGGDAEDLQKEDAAVVKDESAQEEETGVDDVGTQSLQEEEAVDPQGANMGTEQGTEVDVTALLSSGSVAETNEITIGIDVAKYQGTIDWAQVAASGIDFAMVRVGYRADATREICADTNARYNMQEAQKNGIKVGAYFFSTAATVEEAKEEADWVADYIAGYQITYPVAYDCEGFDKPDSAQYHLTNAQRTDIAIAFVLQIYSRGYTPMFYSSMGELTGNAKWDTTRIEQACRIWVAQYPAEPYPQTEKSAYGGTHGMWQYTNRGTVAGIGRPVDVNVAYFGYESAAAAQSTETPEEAHADVEALMKFTQVSETVTAKDSTNLRSIPSQGEDSTVVYTLQNGESAERTGVSDSGWSRLIFNGQTVYAVSSYLTTDMNYQVPAEEGAGSGDGLKTKFAERSDQVTAKMEVNLRTLPSVTNPDAAVAAVLHNGEYVTRTGINEEYGWSRVDYNGQTLYCVSSYLTN